MKNLFLLFIALVVTNIYSRAEQIFELEVEDGIYTVIEKNRGMYDMDGPRVTGKLQFNEEEVQALIKALEKAMEPSGPFGGTASVEITYTPVEYYFYSQCKKNEDYKIEGRTAVINYSSYGYGYVLWDVGCEPKELWRLGSSDNVKKLIKLLKGEYETNSVVFEE